MNINNPIRPDPIQLPNLKKPCTQCGKETPTKIVFIKKDIGNACAVCGRFRQGKPYVSKDWVYNHRHFS